MNGRNQVNALLQKWMIGLIGLGAGYLVLTNSEQFYKAATAFRKITSGSIVDVVTGGKG